MKYYIRISFSLLDKSLTMDNTNPWASKWPTTLDWNFDFYKLLNAEGDHLPIGGFEVKKGFPPRVAIVGAGIAGLTAARELIKAGCQNVDIYEASERLGGRTFSVKAKGQRTVYELGAMRIPFFESKSENKNPSQASSKAQTNSILGYYRELFHIGVKDFPMPGSANCYTAAYINDGSGILGHNEQPKMLKWIGDEVPQQISSIDSAGEVRRKQFPDIAELAFIHRRWNDFAKTFKDFVCNKYNSMSQEKWREYWKSIVKHYHNKDFRQLVFEENYTSVYQAKLRNKQKKGKKGEKMKPKFPQSIINKFDKGIFGGLGLRNDQATTFFTIGAGDGGWGAFYDISSLYVIRVLLGGYGTDQKLITGRHFDNLDHSDTIAEPLEDTLGNKLEKPQFLGVQSFAECLFYLPISTTIRSIHELSVDKRSQIGFFINENVQEISVLESSPDNHEITVTSKNFSRKYDAVILTTPTWATQVNLNLKFPKEMLPHRVIQSMKFSHWINSCKVFFPLKERFWDKEKFPQVLLTDTFIQDVYIYAADEKDAGVLLASYTWEDNSMKMLGFKSEKELADACLHKLDEIFAKCQLKKPGTNDPLIISNLVNRESPVTIHWSKLPNYAGCSKLYRQNNETENYRLLNYNREYSEKSGLYFAGEAFSVEGGWIEPAVRLAVDAVIHLIHHKGKLRGGFDYEDYADLTNTAALNGLS